MGRQSVSRSGQKALSGAVIRAYALGMDLPSESQMRWILRSAATLHSLGAEPVAGLVLPNGEYFPDAFDGSPASVAALVRRVQAHAGFSDLEIELGVVTPEGEGVKVSCSSGACGGLGEFAPAVARVTEVKGGRYRVMLGAAELKHPVVFTTALVRAVSHIFMRESGALDEFRGPDVEPAIDLAGVLLGFGVLLSNGSYVYSKGCGGVNVHSATKMPVEDLALSLAIFCMLHNVPGRVAAKYLELTPRECFEESLVWAQSNKGVLKKLSERPEVILRDDYSLSEARSWLSRKLGIGKKRSLSVDDELLAMERELLARKQLKGAEGAAPSKPDAKKLSELRALVDESLDSAG